MTLEPIRDNSLFSEGDEAAGADENLFSGRVNNDTGRTRRALLDFDLTMAGIPTGATITDVSLNVNVSLGNGSDPFSLHELLADWGEGTSVGAGPGGGRGGLATTGDATFQHTFFPDQFWTNIGGDFDPVASATTQIQGPGDYSFSSQGLIDDVTAWLADPSSNHGWILIGDEQTPQSARRFGSRENTTPENRPQLTIAYETSTVDPSFQTQEFQNVVAVVDLVSGGARESISLSGTASIETTFAGQAAGDALDVSPADGLDEVQTEIIALSLNGESDMLGPVVLSLDTTNGSLGSLTERVNNTPGVLDLEPFASGDGDAEFGLFFVLEDTGNAPMFLRNMVPLQLSGARANFDPGATEDLVSSNSVSLVDQSGADTGFSIDSVTLRSVGSDFGDAPDTGVGTGAGNYQTLAGDGGASHVIAGPRLGDSVDAEFDGQPSVSAESDDQGGASDDEDGVSFAAGGVVQVSSAETGTGSVDINLQNADPVSNLLNAWIDWNGDGDWDDAGEQIFTDFDLGTVDGIQTLSYLIPQDIDSNFVRGLSYARFRLSTAGGLSPVGPASNGEVEDHLILIEDPPTVVTGFQRVNPLGSQISERSITGDLSVVGQRDLFSVSVDPGTTVTFALTPDATLQGEISVFDSGGTLVGTASAAVPGTAFAFQTGISTGGTFEVSINAQAGTTGSYTIETILNSAVENEDFGGTGNDSSGSAQNLESSFILLPGGIAERGAVLGTAQADSDDVYEFTGTFGTASTLLVTGDVTLSLLDNAGNLLAVGVETDAGEQVIQQFRPGTTESLFVVIRSDTDGEDYSLVLTRESDFDTEDNNSIETAQEITTAIESIGYVSAGLDSDFYSVQANLGDIIAAQTQTHADGSADPVNLLDPRLEVFDPSGTLLTSNNNSSADGRNASVGFFASVAGTYTIAVSAENGSSGEYLLDVFGQSGTDPAPSVVSSVPEDTGSVTSFPSTYTLDFSESINLQTVEAGDLLIGGLPATGVTVVDGDTLVFDVDPAANVGLGTYPVALATGSVEDLQGTGNLEFTSSFELLAGPAFFVVTTEEDELDFSNDNVSLREAIDAANNSVGANTITFDPLVSNVVLSLGELTISDVVTIDGSNAAINANQASRVFNVPTGDFDVTLRGLLVTGGQTADSGGGVHFGSTGQLTIEDSFIVGNTADTSAVSTGGGGIFSVGDLIVRNSTVLNNTTSAEGGGIRLSNTASSLLVTGSTIADNQAEFGGGISADQLTIQNSTLSGNIAADSGGAVFSFTGNTSIGHSTITANQAAVTGGGILLGGGTTATLGNTIAAGNLSGGVIDVDGAVESTSSYNLIGDGTGLSGITDGDQGNQIGTDTAPIDAMLEPLGDNGGATPTHALQAGSPAIDAGDPNLDGSVLAFDQRGAPQARVSGGQIDIGAFEATGPNQMPTFTVGDPVTVNEDAGRQTVSDFITNFDPGFGESGTSTNSQVLQDEGVGGMVNPLSTDNFNPTPVGPLALGFNTILGSLGNAANTGNVDVFTFTIPEGLQLSGLFVDDFAYPTPPPPNERNAFLAINDEDFFPFNTFDLDINSNPDLDTTQFLGGSVFGLDDLESAGGGNILPRVGTVTGRGFTGPLGAGTYTVYIQQTGPANTYTLDFQVTTVTAQTLASYTVSNVSDPSLFAQGPSIDNDGNLIYTPAEDANGAATFEITAQDSGGTVSGGTDTSEIMLGTLTLNPVNDAPSFAATDPPSVIENSGAQAVAGFASFIAGPANEDGQAVLAYQISNVEVPGLFASGPEIDADGNLTYTLAADVFGTSTFDVSVQDNGGTDSGGVDTSPAQTFTITVEEQILLDFGDAPSDYPVLLADDGARHITSGLFLGDGVSIDADGQPTATADGDDDDGVVFLSDLVASSDTSTTASFQVFSSGDGQLDAWIDFNQDNDWDDPGEQITTSLSVTSGSNILSFTVPAGASSGETAARFRISSEGMLTPTGAAADGEVEDYLINLLDAAVIEDATVNLFDVFSVILRSVDDLQVRSNQIDLFTAPVNSIGQLQVLGTNEDNALFIDFSGGEVIHPGGLGIDGSGGNNELRLTNGDGGLDFTDDSINVVNFVSIDLGFDDQNSITVNGPTVQALSPITNEVIVIGGQDDTIIFADAPDWSISETSVVNGRFIRRFTNAATGGVIDADLGRVWQNFVNASDVNNNGEVTAGDALIIINELARGTFSDSDTGGLLVDPTTLSEFPDFYYDQNADGNVTALDALRVINELARLTGIGADGERFSGEGEDVTAAQIGSFEPIVVSAIDDNDLSIPPVRLADAAEILADFSALPPNVSARTIPSPPEDLISKDSQVAAETVDDLFGEEMFLDDLAG